MTRDYKDYLLGCSAQEEVALPYWLFLLEYSLYQRHYYDALDFNLTTGELRLRKDYFPLVPWARLRRLARTVDRGREMAQSGGYWREDDDGPAGGSGVREPLRPVPPPLDDAAARPLEPPVYDYDRSMLY